MRIRLIPNVLLAGAMLLGTQAASAQMSHQMATSPMTAGDLRVALNQLLAEHVQLAAAATGSALGGRNGEFKAAAGALDANSVALSKAIGSVYGVDAEASFLALWRTHIGFFVNYATAVAKKDKVGQGKAVDDLTGYATTFGVFLNHANPNLPVAVVEGLFKTHVVTLKSVVDAQGKGDFATAYSVEREAVAHMQMVADPLASAISQQFPEKFALK